MSWELIIRQKFSAAHFLREYQGKCEKMHGHTFEVEVFIKADKLNNSGISFDFTELKSFLKNFLPDHKTLNEEFSFSPSAENLARFFYQQLKKSYPVSKVVVWESSDCGAAYAED